MEREIDRQISVDSGVMWSMYRFVVVKELRNYIYIYIPTITYDHELWVMTEKTRSWIQVVKRSFLLRVAG